MSDSDADFLSEILLNPTSPNISQSDSPNVFKAFGQSGNQVCIWNVGNADNIIPFIYQAIQQFSQQTMVALRVADPLSQYLYVTCDNGTLKPARYSLDPKDMAQASRINSDDGEAFYAFYLKAMQDVLTHLPDSNRQKALVDITSGANLHFAGTHSGVDIQNTPRIIFDFGDGSRNSTMRVIACVPEAMKPNMQSIRNAITPNNLPPRLYAVHALIPVPTQPEP